MYSSDKNRLQYGFYGRLKPDFPSQVIIDTTELCNLACIHCPHSAFEKSKYYSGACLSPDLNAKAIDEVRNHGKGITQYIRYSGEGETLLNRHFIAMLDYAVKQSGGVQVTISTNGLLLDDDRIRRILATGVHVIDISIDAYSPDVYQRIRRRGELNQVRTNTQNLININKMNEARAKIVVSYVEQPINTHETQLFESYWKCQGADYVVIRRMHSAAGAVADVAEGMRIQEAGVQRRPCVYPWERIVLNPRGHLAFCPADWTHGSTLLDYNKTTIKDLWQSDQYRQLRNAHLTNDFHEFPFCGQCPDWKLVRWPEEGRSYADMIEEFTRLK